MNSEVFLDAALHYASIGWRVFPLAPGQKTPITKHGVKDATTDEEQIRDWWCQWEYANIGLACGGDAGLYVIDVDVDEGKGIDGRASLAQLPDLPETIRQGTPRGGFHAFYTASIPPANKNSFLPGIDIRGDGYYVVLAPSIHPNGGQYKWEEGHAPWEITPAAYPDFMRPTKSQPQQRANPPQLTTTYDRSNVLKRASCYLATCDPAVEGLGGHDKLLYAASRLVHGFLLTDSEAYDLLAREYNPVCQPPWDLSIDKDRRDFERKVKEARRLTPNNQPGWLIDDPAYEPISEAIIDVTALLDSFEQRKAECQSNLVETVFEDMKNAASEDSPTSPYGMGYWLEKPQEISVVTDAEHDFLCRPTGLLGSVCSWLNSTAIREQPLLSVGCGLAFLGTLFGRKIKDELGARSNMYCLGVAQSSAGKSHAMRQIRRLCLEAGCIELLGGDDIASDAAIEERISKQPATLFLWDEIGHFLKHLVTGANTHHAQVIKLLMKLYSCAGDVFLGREYSDQEKQRIITQPCCCLYGVSTREVFIEGLTPENLQDGWLGRLLIFQSFTKPQKMRGRSESNPPEELVKLVNEWFVRRVDPPTDGSSIAQFVSPSGYAQPPSQIIIPASKEAEDLFIALDNESDSLAGQNNRMAAGWAKAEENARRVALIIAAGENFNNPNITKANADYACRLIRFLTLGFEDKIEPEVVATRIEKDLRKIFNIVDGGGIDGVLKRIVTKRTRTLQKRQRAEHLELLVETGEIAIAKHRNSFRYWSAVNYAKFLEALKAS